MYKLDQNMQPSDLGNKPRKILRKTQHEFNRVHTRTLKKGSHHLTSELTQKVKEVHGLFLVGQNWKKTINEKEATTEWGKCKK